MSPKVIPYLEPLEDIEARARKNFGDCTGLYLHYIIREFSRYWRGLQKREDPFLAGKVWDQLNFYFDQKLREIATIRLEMEWLIFEYDNEQLFDPEHEPGPFWRT
ncbi:hypothetical protein [Motiliproteus coralliicola]|uniref:hypothetical protein n=1 Tax=Motiliproteus coralliicola TaxID=2283196 RepID=UPI001059076A|nr:hypothetical protein [Motiliproteus coralliicola]